MSIIDCGHRNALRGPGGKLLDELNSHGWGDLSSIVVTHFDQDHWRGLQWVARRLQRSPLPLPLASRSDPLPIYWPRIPWNVPSRSAATLTTLISVTSRRTRVEALDLRDDWNAVLAKAASSASLRAVRRGDTIDVAGRWHQVVWPPEELPPTMAGSVNGLVQEIEDLADDLAHRGKPHLREALDEAYAPHEAAPRPRGAEAGERSEEEAEGHQGEEDPPISPEVVPTERVMDVEKLVRRARDAQNLLSLVFHDACRGSLLVYGDAPADVVGLVRGHLLDLYGVLLAPHHGTHSSPVGAPFAGQCIAQGPSGPYKDRWRDNHVPAHDQPDPFTCVHLSDKTSATDPVFRVNLW